MKYSMEIEMLVLFWYQRKQTLFIWILYSEIISSCQMSWSKIRKCNSVDITEWIMIHAKSSQHLHYIWFCRDLQSTTNYFLMSLALADLLVCTVVMPFGALSFIVGENFVTNSAGNPIYASLHCDAYRCCRSTKKFETSHTPPTGLS